jgi:HPt (histidine-containing phosphotransfer) domain-containing protein
MGMSANEATDIHAAIDRGHLSRMTLGNRTLEIDVLQLFDRQAAILIERMRGGDGAAIGGLAHTLKGSALGIGAGPVARAAQSVEQAAAGADAGQSIGDAIDRLAVAVEQARALIAMLLAEG